MGQVSSPASADILLTAVDRLTAINAAEGLDPAATHIIALGEEAMLANPLAVGASHYIVAIGPDCASLIDSCSEVIGIGDSSAREMVSCNNMVALGYAALYRNENSSRCIGIGENAGGQIENSSEIICLGRLAGDGVLDSGGCYFIGSQAGQSIDTCFDIIGIGSVAGAYIVNSSSVVSIGTFAGNVINCNDVVAVGQSAADQADTCDDIVAIGNNAGGFSGTTLAGMVGASDVIAIGRNAAAGNTFSEAIAIGSLSDILGESAVSVGNGAMSSVRSVAYGREAGSGWIGDDVVAIGYRAGYRLNNSDGAANLCRGSVVLGPGASADFSNNKGLDPALSRQFYVGSNAQSIANQEYALLYGNFETGNLILGDSSNTVDRDLESIGTTNAFKILNGARGAGNPVGGGFFYVSAGALHWVGSAGTDTVVAPA